LDAGSTFGFTAGKLGKTALKSEGVELADGKYSDTTLSAPGAADEPRATPAGGVRQRGIHDLD
jgi:hypothetical protein